MYLTRKEKELQTINTVISDSNKFYALSMRTRIYILERYKQLNCEIGKKSARLNEMEVFDLEKPITHPCYHYMKIRPLSPEYTERRK